MSPMPIGQATDADPSLALGPFNFLDRPARQTRPFRYGLVLLLDGELGGLVTVKTA